MKKHIYVTLLILLINTSNCKKQNSALKNEKKRADIDKMELDPPYDSSFDSGLSQGMNDFSGSLESAGSGEAGLHIGEHLGASGYDTSGIKGGSNPDKFINGGFSSLHNQDNTNEIFNQGGLVDDKYGSSAFMGDYNANYGEAENDMHGYGHNYRGQHGSGQSQHAAYSEKAPYGRYRHQKYGYHSGGHQSYHGFKLAGSHGGHSSFASHGISGLSGLSSHGHHGGSRIKRPYKPESGLSSHHMSQSQDEDRCSECECDPCATIELNIPTFCTTCSQCSKCTHARECSVEFVAAQCCNPLYLDMSKNPPCNYFDTHNCQIHNLVHAMTSNQYYLVDIGLNTKWNDNMNNVNSNMSQFVRNQIQDFLLRIYADHDYYQETWLLKLTPTGTFPTAKILVRFTREAPGNIALLEKTIKCGCGCYFIQPESVKIEPSNQTEVVKFCPQRCRVPTRDCGASSSSCLPMCCMLKEIHHIDEPLVDPQGIFTTPGIHFTTPKPILPEILPPTFPKECPLSCHETCDQICPQMCCPPEPIPQYKHFKRHEIAPEA